MAPLNNCSTSPLLAKMQIQDEIVVPVTKTTEAFESSSEEVNTLDHNHNEVRTPTKPGDQELLPKNAVVEEPPKQQLKRPSPEDINARTRKMVFSMFDKHLNTDLNVLVIGQRESGKTSLINSMSMALTQKWSDKARYCPGRNHVIEECIIHKNKAGGKVVFSDARGFEDIHETEHAILILRYVLEGRIPAKCIPCVLLMSKELIKKRYRKAYDPCKKIDCVLFVSAINEPPSSHLMMIVQQALANSKHSSVKRVPIVSITTKSDLLSEEDRSQMEKSRGLFKYSLEHVLSETDTECSYSQQAPRKVYNYCCELETFSDESVNPTTVKPSIEKDIQLLAVWRDIITRMTGCGDHRKRALSTTSSSRPRACGCLPFYFDYKRLRSGSF